MAETSPSTIRTTAKAISGQVRSRRPAPKARNQSFTASLCAVSACPFDTTKTNPRIAVKVPSVTIKALMPTTSTITPFRRPAQAATATAIIAAGQKPIVSAVNIKMAPDSAATEPTERSKFAVIRTTVMATAMIATSDD